MTKKELDALRKRWESHREDIKANKRVRNPHEDAREKAARISLARDDFGFFVEEYFPHYARSASPDFHLELANAVLEDKHLKGTVNWYRGAAKSVLADILIPLWLMVQAECELKFMVVIGSNHTAAIRLLNDIKSELEFNERLTEDFSVGKKSGDWADDNFSASNGTKFVALGMGQPVQGLRKGSERPDYIVIDDIDDLELSRNPARMTRLVKWIEGRVLGTFGVQRSRLLIVNNCIAKDQVMSRMVQRKPHWRHFFKPALDAAGRPAWPELHDLKYWNAKRRDVGEASFSTEYMLVPVNEGTRFQEAWIKWLPAGDIARAVVYIDPSWRNTTTSDHKACKCWVKHKDGTKHLLKAFVRKAETDEMVQWCFDFFEQSRETLPVSLEFYIEGIFMQDDFMAEFDREAMERGYFLPIMPDYRKKPQKESRIESMIPQYKRGLISYEASQRNDPDMMVAVDHLLGWDIGCGLPDDSPDADESAMYILDHVTAFSGEAGQVSFGKVGGGSSSKYGL
mgnify:CR=1 FL=1